VKGCFGGGCKLGSNPKARQDGQPGPTEGRDDGGEKLALVSVGRHHTEQRGVGAWRFGGHTKHFSGESESLGGLLKQLNDRLTHI